MIFSEATVVVPYSRPKSSKSESALNPIQRNGPIHMVGWLASKFSKEEHLLDL
jgi:hypothetical protein